MAARLNITLRQMRAFVEAYRLRNLTHAADALHVTQSAMSGLIRELEAELGVRLFERAPRVLRPTRAADDAYVGIEAILQGIATLGTRMRDHAENIEHVLAFTCSPTLSSTVVPTVLAEFKRWYPKVRTVIADLADASLIQRVLNGDAEFSIGFYEHEPEAISRVALVADHLCAVCLKDWPLARRKRATWKDLLGVPLIDITRSTQVQQIVSQALANVGGAHRPAYEVTFLDTALAMAEQGLGAVVIPGYLVKGNPHVNSLVAKQLHDPLIERNLLVHTRQGHVLSSPAKAFLDMMRKHLERAI